MNVLWTIAAGTGEDWWTRFTKWLLNFDYDKIEKEDIVKFRLLGMPEGWGLLVTVVLVAAMVWFTFFLYRREGKTAYEIADFYWGEFRKDLARLEITVMVTEWLKRVPDFHVDAAAASRPPSSFQWGWNRIPVEVG